MISRLHFSVAEIALRSGFTNPAVFARAFRERFSMTASQWRKKSKANRKTGQAPSEGIATAYKALYGEWLPESGFVPASQPPIEVYLSELGNRPEANHFVMDIYVPVEPA